MTTAVILALVLLVAYFATLARRRYGHDVTVDNMAFLRRQPGYTRPTRTP